MQQPHILVVEDEAVARRVLHSMLTHAGYAVTSVASGEEALECLQSQHFDLLLTDLQLRNIDGVTVMAAAREHDPDIEVIVLTGSATVDSAIAAVRHGAHNYILKPGQPGEIESSVAEALHQRQNRIMRAAWLQRLSQDLLQLANSQTNSAAPLPPARPAETLLQIGGLTIDLQRHTVMQNGRYLQLSSGEFSLLAYLARHTDQVVAPQQLARDVLGYECTPQEARDLIKARIWSLRRKIESDPTDPHMIVSVRGVGYMLTGDNSS